MTKAKPFDIPKREVWEAFKKVKANQGAAGVDGQSIADFEVDLANNLYKLWNRLSSGSYLPQPVRRVDIPKATGGRRSLGMPRAWSRRWAPVFPLSSPASTSRCWTHVNTARCVSRSINRPRPYPSYFSLKRCDLLHLWSSCRFEFLV
jgi:hypothetical protein